MTRYVIPYEFNGTFICEAATEAEARELFEAMSLHELAQAAELWADDRTFTEDGYARAIKAVWEKSATEA